MTDYTELVKALRYCSKTKGMVYCNVNCKYGWEERSEGCKDLLMTDAAAAIEELQAQLPKRGEWTEIEDYDGDFHYQCSVCGEEWYFIDGTPADNNANYCPRCGAKMEVQDGDV